ncbi:MAG: hypothetical protein IRZ03_18390 [Acidobacterium ailaaui]|nr:hypothetical protein [Pseudacidobacterium ailaaui]
MAAMRLSLKFLLGGKFTIEVEGQKREYGRNYRFSRSIDSTVSGGNRAIGERVESGDRASDGIGVISFATNHPSWNERQ